MDKAVAIIAAALMLLLVFPALRRIPMNEMLRNIIVWLSVFLVLGLLYRFFHPEEDAGPDEAEVRLEQVLR